MGKRLRRFGWVFGPTLVLSSFGSADESLQLQFRLGLWQIAVHPEVAGAAALAGDQLSRLPPDQRARVQALVESAIAQASKPRTYKECMTEEKRSRGFKAAQPSGGSSCSSTIVTNTANDFEMHEQCPATRTTATVHFHLADSNHITGTVVASTPSISGPGMTLHSTIDGQWLSMQCGDVKDVEPVN